MARLRRWWRARSCVFKHGQGFAGGGLRGAFERGDVARRPGASGLAAVSLVDFVEDGATSGLGLNCSLTAAMSCKRVALRKARRKRWLCARARPKLESLAKITAHEKRLESASRPRTVSAIGPLFWIISTMALPPAAAGGAVWSGWKMRRAERLRIGVICRSFHVSRGGRWEQSWTG